MLDIYFHSENITESFWPPILCTLEHYDTIWPTKVHNISYEMPGSRKILFLQSSTSLLETVLLVATAVIW